MTPGYIQGTAAEVRLADILPPSLACNSTKAIKEAFAAAYEEKHGIVVVRDWEEVPDSVIASVAPEEQKSLLQARIDLQRRREAHKAKPKVEGPKMGMDPVRAERELRRQRQMLAGLTVDHPDYARLFATTVHVIHELEDCCEMPRTPYQMGVVPERAGSTITPELQDKYNRYAQLNRDKRRKSIQFTEDLPYVRLISINEQDAELQEMALMRVAQLQVTVG